MTPIILYFVIATVILYTEATDSYKTSSKFKLGESLVFSLAWGVSIPFAIYTIWREMK